MPIIKLTIIIKIHAIKTITTIGKQNKHISIMQIIDIKANGTNIIELYMKDRTKQIVYMIDNAHPTKRSSIFLILALLFILVNMVSLKYNYKHHLQTYSQLDYLDNCHMANNV